MKRVAILQSNYIPWKGYFDLIASVDTFVLYDDMQYTKRDWRNRNKIKTPKGTEWLSIPVRVSGKFHQKINEVIVSDTSWSEKHWSTIASNYKKSPHYDQVVEWLQPLYVSLTTKYLSEINFQLISHICAKLGIETEIVFSSNFQLLDEKNMRLVDLCEQLNASEYISGPAAKEYLDLGAFSKRSISVQWADYSGYRQYSQLWGDFEHSVTILDLLFNTGESAGNYMKFIK